MPSQLPFQYNMGSNSPTGMIGSPDMSVSLLPPDQQRQIVFGNAKGPMPGMQGMPPDQIASMLAAARANGQADADRLDNDAVNNRQIRLQNQQMFPNLKSSYAPIGNERVSDPSIQRQITESDRQIALESPYTEQNQYIQSVQAAKAALAHPLVGGMGIEDRVAHALAPYGNIKQGATKGSYDFSMVNDQNPIAQFLKLKGGDDTITSNSTGGLSSKPLDYRQIHPFIQHELDNGGGDVIKGMPHVNPIAYDPAFRLLAVKDPDAANRLYSSIASGRQLQNDLAMKSANPQTQGFIDDSMKLATNAIQTKFAQVDTDPKSPYYKMWTGIVPNTGIGITSKERVPLSADEQRALDFYHQQRGTPAPLTHMRAADLDNEDRKAAELDRLFDHRNDPKSTGNPFDAVTRGPLDINVPNSPLASPLARQQAAARGPLVPNSPLARQQAAATASNAAAGMVNPNFGNSLIAGMNSVDESWNRAGNMERGIANLGINAVNQTAAGVYDAARNLFTGRADLSQSTDFSNPNVYPTLNATRKAPNYLQPTPTSVKLNSGDAAISPIDSSLLSSKMNPGLLQALQKNPRFMEIYHRNPDQAKAVIDQYQKQAAAQAAQQAPLPVQGL